MRPPYLLVWSVLLFSCVPGTPFIPKKSDKANTLQPLGSDAIPSQPIPTPPDDEAEEDKAMEPGIIGGAYLYCDADEGKPGENPKPPMLVGCRLGNVDELDWVAAPKDVKVTNMNDGSPAPCAVTIPVPGSPYHILFDADRSLQNILELHLNVTLPQGKLNMSTTINPGSTKAVAQRIGKGLALYASIGAAGDWPGVDRKTWDLWMPLKIPGYVSNLSSSSGPGGLDKNSTTIELNFDSTVCTYRSVTPKPVAAPKDAKAEDYFFSSCSKAGWLPDQWVRSKSLSLRIISDGAAGKGGITAGVVLQTEP